MNPELRTIWKQTAKKDLRRLESALAQRLILAVELFAETGRGDVKSLQGSYQSLFRLRIGDWRILLQLEGDVLYVMRVLPRGQAYK